MPPAPKTLATATPKEGQYIKKLYTFDCVSGLHNYLKFFQPPLVFRLGSVNTDEVPYYLNGARGKFGEHEKRVRVPRGDSRSNSNLLSAREIYQMYDNSIQCNSAQLKALTNCFITLPVEMCIQTDAKTCAKRNTGDAIS